MKINPWVALLAAVVGAAQTGFAVPTSGGVGTLR